MMEKPVKHASLGVGNSTNMAWIYTFSVVLPLLSCMRASGVHHVRTNRYHG